MVNFDIQYNKDRVKEVERELQTSEKPTNSQLQMLADYILFGKDDEGKSPVDRKEIEIETKYNTYKRNRTQSLEALLESPAFSEVELQKIKKNVYLKQRIKINKNLEGLQPYNEAIENYEKQMAQMEQQEPATHEEKTKLWKLKHLIINLKKERYAIYDMLKGDTIICQQEPFFELEESYFDEVAPMGLKIGALTRFDDPRRDRSRFTVVEPSEGKIDLENEEHIHLLLDNYLVLKEVSFQNPYSNTKYLLETLDWYIDRIKFKESRKIIIDLKKQKCSNKFIKQVLLDKFGYNYSPNYISTIYTKEICRKIAEEVSFHKKEWQNRTEPKKWKTCICCNKTKLLDAKNFTRKRSNRDGFTGRCKECQK